MSRSNIARPLPDLEYLRQCFAYDASTGVLTWLARPREHFASELGYRTYLAQRVGNRVGSKAKSGYLSVRVDNTLYYVHRIAWVLHHGRWPEGEIDHVNGLRDDNRILNLRDVTGAVNHRNQVRRSDNVSGHNGVHWSRQRRRWVAQIVVGGKVYFLGHFDDLEKAVAARQRANKAMDFTARHGLDLPAGL